MSEHISMNDRFATDSGRSLLELASIGVRPVGAFQKKRAVRLTARDKISDIDVFQHSGKKDLPGGSTGLGSNEKWGEDIRTIPIGLEFNDDPTCCTFKAP